MIKLLYITNGITGSGGLERVLAIKTSALAETYGYCIHILMLNEIGSKPFYLFSDKITFHNVNTRSQAIPYFLDYRKGIKRVIKKIAPNIISVCDDGLKGMLFPVIFKIKIPVIYERHVSKNINKSFIPSFILNKIIDFGTEKFNKFIVLTEGNKKEWKCKNLLVIPNPLPFYPSQSALLLNKTVLAVGKQSYQKNYEDLLKIWKNVIKKHPRWKLEIYGKINLALNLTEKSQKLNIENSVKFYPPNKNIENKYKEAAIYVMTSKFEGFGMVLIEAMAFGVPCVSFECPHGPADIITDTKDGYLVPNGDLELFSKRLITLIEDEELRKKMGKHARENVKVYLPENIIKQWDSLFKSLICKK